MFNTHLSAIQQNYLIDDAYNLGITPDLSSIYVLTEYKTTAGKPIDGKVNLDYIFNYIINDISDADVNLDIGREIRISDDIRSTGNYNKFSALYNIPDDTIAYDDLVALQNLTTDNIVNLIDDILGVSSGSKSDNIDLCITTAMLSDLSGYIAGVTNKIFRNLNQLVRVKRDWRLYGPGATLSGNYLTSSAVTQTHSTVPAECFTQYKSGYVAGAAPYGEATTVAAVVDQAQTCISPASVFTVAEHKHAITFNVDRNATEINHTSGPWAGPYDSSDWSDDDDESAFVAGLCRVGSYYYLTENTTWVIIGEADRKGLRTLLMSSTTGAAKMGVTCALNYSSAKKYLSTTGSVVDDTHFSLPAYSTYMWQWINDDTTTL